jgi:hypothetical protein
MSRNNVFKLSGNMALGGGEGYGNNNDFDNIKNSLKLLKSKKAEQKLQEYPSEPKVRLSLFRTAMEGRTLPVRSSASRPSARVRFISYRSWFQRLSE